MKVLVAHPELQHAHQLAWALDEAGMLDIFWTGVPVVDSRKTRSHSWGLFGSRVKSIPVSFAKRRHAVIFPLMRRLLSSRHLAPLTRDWIYHLKRAFDRWIAIQIRLRKPDMVICYENSALHSFRAARAVGAICVLDAASIHHQAGRKWLSGTGRQDPLWIDARKAEEIALADAILTCSEFAAETYRAAGVSPERIIPMPVGTVLPQVGPVEKPLQGPCRFVFSGTLMRRKAVDLLLDIFESFHRQGIPATLTLIGGVTERDLADRAGQMPNVNHLSFMPQSALFEEIAQHDCLLLPSRFDSFGMVVPEAMAVGVPAIVSERVGAKCIIEQHPDAGWIVPCDADAIATQMLELIRHRERLAEASAAARRAAQDYTWASYRTRVVDALTTIRNKLNN